MGIKVFIDVNVLLDFFLKRKGFAEAEQIVKAILDHKIDAYISISVLQTLSFYLQKEFGSLTAKELLLELLTSIKIIESDKQVVLQALTSNLDDIEDAVHYFTAIFHNLDYIITNDTHFQRAALSILAVLSVREFVSLVGIDS